ncbi:MAG TPA: hypothetical protein VKN18_13995 [Blastocatellia bacterium]|nr:hypothetical protein [Blastocatellia bacterium]
MDSRKDVVFGLYGAEKTERKGKRMQEATKQKGQVERLLFESGVERNQ